MAKWVFLFLGLLTIKYAFAMRCYELTKEKLVNGKLSPLVSYKTEACDILKLSKLLGRKSRCYEFKVTEENGDEYVSKGCIENNSSEGCEKMVADYKALRFGGNQNNNSHAFQNVTQEIIKNMVYSDPFVYCRECTTTRCNDLGKSAADHINFNLFVPLFSLLHYITLHYYLIKLN